jgi:hypothetical protein
VLRVSQPSSFLSPVDVGYADKAIIVYQQKVLQQVLTQHGQDKKAEGSDFQEEGSGFAAPIWVPAAEA